LSANTWAQRKEGVPLDLLDKLSEDELKTAEVELIKSANLGDTWPILGLGHIKSTQALPTLYDLLDKSKKSCRVTIAYSIFQISNDQKMIDIVLQELPKTTNQYELIEVLYMLPAFKDEKIKALLNNYRDHKEYLVAYNATRALGLSTDEVVKKFRQRNKKKNFWKRIFG
jgi:HEAT repeat protein